MRLNSGDGLPLIEPVVGPEDIIKAREAVTQVYIDEKIEKYIVRLIDATRKPKKYKLNILYEDDYYVYVDFISHLFLMFPVYQ